ncbi:MAG: N-acetylmuramoyl-L-alanine amidase [Veillonellales bacterium]
MGNIVQGRQVTMEELRQLAADSKEKLLAAAQSVGRDGMLYLHWSAGHYHQHYDDYHISLDDDGIIYVTTDDLSTVLAHTWHRNTGAVGISLACGAFCTANDLGAEPPTDCQIESMARVVAVLSGTLEIPIDVDHVMTHAEAADLDGYGPATTCERWDLAILHNGDEWMSGGNMLRSKAVWYQKNGVEV